MSGVKASAVRAAIVAAVAAITLPMAQSGRFGVTGFRRVSLPIDDAGQWGHLDYDVRYGPSISPDRGRIGSQIKTAFVVQFAYRLSAGTKGQLEDEDGARDLAELVAGACLLTTGGASTVLESIETVTAPTESRVLATIGVTIMHPLAG